VTRLGTAIDRLQAAELDLAADFREVGERHDAEPDVHHLTRTLAQQCEEHAERLRPFSERNEASGVHGSDGDGAGLHPIGVPLLDDLRRLFVTAQNVGVLWVMVAQAARSRRDRELVDVCDECHAESVVQMHWLLTRIKESAPQALTSS
jgi:hypothetical protein